MNDGAPAPPANQPEPRSLAPAPEISPGFRLDTTKDVFLKFLNIREVAKSDHQERINGVRISFVIQVLTNVVFGWSHSTVIGGSLTHIKGPDLKLGCVALLGFTFANKTEITKGNKNEYIYGLKVSHVTGKKSKFQGSNRLSNSAVEKAEFMNKCADYWNLRKEIAAQLKETIKVLNCTNSTIEETVASYEVEFSKAKVDSQVTAIRGNTLKADIATLHEQATNAKTHATASLKVIADAAADFEAGANWDGDFGGQLQMMSSLQEFAAAISKLG